MVASSSPSAAIPTLSARPTPAGAGGRKDSQPLDEPLGVVARRPAEDHGELVAADPPDDVDAAYRGAQDVRRLDERAVTGAVAERVVDRLQPVDVEEQHAQRGAVAIGAVDQAATEAVQPASVVQTGQLVAQRELLEFGCERFELPALLRQQLGRRAPLGDVARQTEDADHLALGPEERDLCRRDPGHRAVGPHLAFLLADRGLARRHDPPFVGLRLGCVLLGEEVGVAEADRVVGAREPHPVRKGEADPREPALGVLEVDVVGRAPQERLEQVALVDDRPTRCGSARCR